MLASLEPGSQAENIQHAAARDHLARRRGRVRVDRADTRGAAAQSRAIRHAVLRAIEDGITDPELLDQIVTAVVAESNPDALSTHVPLFAVTELPTADRVRGRRPAVGVDTAA